MSSKSHAQRRRQRLLQQGSEAKPTGEVGLVLSRRPGERIILAHGLITITVNRISGNAVSIGIRAPADVDIFREEIAPAPNEQDETQETQLQKGA